MGWPVGPPSLQEKKGDLQWEGGKRGREKRKTGCCNARMHRRARDAKRILFNLRATYDVPEKKKGRKEKKRRIPQPALNLRGRVQKVLYYTLAPRYGAGGGKEGESFSNGFEEKKRKINRLQHHLFPGSAKGGEGGKEKKKGGGGESRYGAPAELLDYEEERR